VIAAGGDGTVGSVAGCLAGTEHVLAIMPLGTANDFARSLDIPVNPRLAAMLMASGRITEVDVGRVLRPGEPTGYFVHAATCGINVSFAKLATRASVRARLGRLTYLAAGLTRRRAVRLHLRAASQRRHEQLRLLQLSVINAPIVGGPLGLSVEGSRPDDHRLAVLAVEDVAIPRLVIAGLLLLLRVRRPIAGVRALDVASLSVESGQPLSLALDGELGASLPVSSTPSPAACAC
jgi:diacylglycerol kinase family enzyme